MDIAVNLKYVQEKIKAAALKTGKSDADITLVVVSKEATVGQVEEAYSCGVRDFGENRFQKAKEKLSTTPSDIKWHFIGHLQTNKAKDVLPRFSLIHSLDSYKLAQEISRLASKKEEEARALVQVNIAGEKSKYGLSPGEVKDFLEAIRGLPFLKVTGLMTMAPFVPDPEEVRPYFREMRIIFKTLKVPRISLNYLSMGMSNDFVVALEEGANIVRIGSLIFK